MTDRILDFSENPCRLRVRNEQLIVESPPEDPVSVPLCDIAVVVSAHPEVSCSQAVLAGLAEHGAIFVVCDGQRLPAAMMLPIQGHYLQTERFVAQTALSLPTKKRLWQGIVRAKVRAQGDVLRLLHGEDFGVSAMAARVRSGDPDNVEARAAQRYWPKLFGDSAFRRRREAEDQNRSLNYGYAVLRAVVARAVVAAGLHPSLGLQHSNRYDAFVLADDLMEPFRPLVDHGVAESIREWGLSRNFDRVAKSEVLDSLLVRFQAGGERRTLFDWLSRTSSSLAQVCTGESRELFLPALRPSGGSTVKKGPGRETASNSPSTRQASGRSSA